MCASFCCRSIKMYGVVATNIARLNERIKYKTNAYGKLMRVPVKKLLVVNYENENARIVDGVFFPLFLLSCFFLLVPSLEIFIRFIYAITNNKFRWQRVRKEEENKNNGS